MASAFVSHRGVDMLAATQLASDLRSRGHEVWLDAWKINLGDSIVQRINEGLSGSTYVLLCYSDAGVSAPWMSREWMSTLAQQLNGATVRLLPARLTGGQPPAILADIKYVDLVKDWSSGVDALDAAMR